jgi:hypothetical protein
MPEDFNVVEVHNRDVIPVTLLPALILTHFDIDLPHDYVAALPDALNDVPRRVA